MPPTKPRKKPLTKAEIKKLAEWLHRTTNNVFRIIEARFDRLKIEDSDELFDRLRKEAEQFKCGECNQWLDVSLESPVMDLCNECCDRIDGREEE